MAPKMVTNFRRSLSFPNQPSNTTTSTTKPNYKKTLHVRSASLPCTRTHPIISQLKDSLNSLNTWIVPESGSRSSTWICSGLTRLKSIHESLDDLLLLPQTRESLRSGEYSTNLIQKLLEHFLAFADIYGIFQNLVLRLKHEYSITQIAVRKKDEIKIRAQIKNLSKIGKEFGKLVTNLHSIGKFSIDFGDFSDDDEAELVEVMSDVVKATVLVSVTVFGEISCSLGFRKTTSYFGKKTKSFGGEFGIREFMGVDFGNIGNEGVKMKMREVEDYVVEIEKCGENVFRGLINTRVSLLNVLTQL